MTSTIITSNSNSSGVINNAAVPSRACLFLEILPLEIRREVYRYLGGRYVKHGLDVKSKEVCIPR